MNATNDPAQAAEPRAAEPRVAAPRSAEAGPGAGPAARERARAYLDLWERHVVHTALHGPTTPGRPPE